MINIDEEIRDGDVGLEEFIDKLFVDKVSYLEEDGDDNDFEKKWSLSSKSPDLLVVILYIEEDGSGKW